jgi:hemolysin activation/secretion protein
MAADASRQMKYGAAGAMLALASVLAQPTAALGQEQRPPPPPAPGTDATEPAFDLFEFEVVGNTVLDALAVERAVLPFLGERKTLRDVEAARTTLEKRYQDAGYLTVLVDVPEQRVDQGVVQLRVIEGRVDRLRVTGSRYYDQGMIRERLPGLAPGQVPDFNAVQRQIAAASREERQLQPLLRPGATPGTVEVEVKVTDRLPLSGSVELANRHAPDTVPWRVQGTVRYDNLFQRDHSLAVTAITAPQDTSQSKVLTAAYSAPVGDGRTAVGYLVLSDSVVEPLGASTVVGKGFILGGRWLATASTPTAFHSLGAGFDYKDLKERTISGSTDLSTPLQYMPMQIGYNGSWFGDRSQTALTASFVFGLRALFDRQIECPGNVGPVDQFACRREGADGSFAYLRADLRHSGSAVVLPGSFALRLAGQLATQPLVSPEQFAIGGAETVRGYLEAEASGDHGLLGSFEWRSPDLAPALARWTAASATPLSLRSATAIAFVDAAQVNLMQAAAGQDAHIPLVGAGFGLRLRTMSSVEADLELAWPFKRTYATTDSDPRLHVRVATPF